MRDRERAVAADGDQRVDPVLREAAEQLVGAVDLDPACRRPAAPGRLERVAAVGGAEDRAAQVGDAADSVARQLDQPAVGVVAPARSRPL